MVMMDVVDQDAAKGFRARLIPLGNRASTDQVDAGLAMTVAVWLRKHGKLVKPKLTKQQRRDLRMCFELMDEDGSGRIDAEELGSAFKLLGVRATPSEVDDLLKMVDRQGTGDIGYQGFTQVMTNTMNKMDSEGVEDDGGAAALQAAVPFEITASAYRRKKLIEALREGDRDLIASMAQGQEALRNNLDGNSSGTKPSSRAGRSSSAGGRQPAASPMIAAISAKLKAGRPAKAREGAFKLEGIPHPELFTPEQRQALRQILHRQAAQERMLLESRGLASRSQGLRSMLHSAADVQPQSTFRQPMKPLHAWHLPGNSQAQTVSMAGGTPQRLRTSTPKHAAIQRHLMALQRLANSSTPSAKRTPPPLPDLPTSVQRRVTHGATGSPRQARASASKPTTGSPRLTPKGTQGAGTHSSAIGMTTGLPKTANRDLNRSQSPAATNKHILLRDQKPRASNNLPGHMKGQRKRPSGLSNLSSRSSTGHGLQQQPPGSITTGLRLPSPKF